MSVDHRLQRLAMDLRALHDKLLLKAQFQHAAEAKRIATELDQARLALEQAPAAADTGVIEMPPEEP